MAKGLLLYCVADDDRLQRILENDLILKHDSIWPHGLNFSLHLDSLTELTEFRHSCLRHRWPPEYDTAAKEPPELDLESVRRQLTVSADQQTASDDTTPSEQRSAPNKKNSTVLNSDGR